MTAGLALLVGMIAAAGPVMAQDTTRNGVHIGLNYQPGTKPGVLVLPISGPGGDSAHTIIQRDLDFADAMNVITGIDQEMGDAAVNFAVPATSGAADWRMVVHDASDWIQQAITGSRGIAATRIAFIRDGQIYITDTDGADTRPVTQKGGGPMSPSWHPTGRYLTYSFFAPRGTQIAVLDLT